MNEDDYLDRIGALEKGEFEELDILSKVIGDIDFSFLQPTIGPRDYWDVNCSIHTILGKLDADKALGLVDDFKYEYKMDSQEIPYGHNRYILPTIPEISLTIYHSGGMMREICLQMDGELVIMAYLTQTTYYMDIK